MSGTNRTCFDPKDIPDLLVAAKRGFSWLTLKEHLYGRHLYFGKASGTCAKHFEDGCIDCEVCGPRRRGEEIEKSGRQFPLDAKIYLTFVLPTRRARGSITKQIRRKGGTGWYVPLQNAFALISSVPIRGKGRCALSIEVPISDRMALFDTLLCLWWPKAGRMTRPGWSEEKHPKPEREPLVDLGTTNAT